MRAIIWILLMGVSFLGGIAVAWQPLPFERIYRDFNTFQMYEDGSYEYEKDGFNKTGCITGAICEDKER